MAETSFKVGDVVKVLGGFYTGNIGTVTKVDNSSDYPFHVDLFDLEIVRGVFRKDELELVPMDSKVEKPPHYNQSGDIECIDAIKAQLGPEGFKHYCHGNVAKYLWRHSYKGGLEDLEKAKVYLQWMINTMEELDNVS